VPVAEIGFERPPIEPEPAVAEDKPPPVIEEKPSPPMAPPEAAPAPDKPRRKPAAKLAAESQPEPVIPIVHAPDDPGPDAVAEADPVPETASPPGTWERLRQMFR
jgi:hypothetical protein